MVTELLDKISQEDYNYDDMKDTLERVDENVGVTSQVDELNGQESNDEESAAQQAAQDAESEAAAETETETEVSILDNTNDDAFGDDVITGSTQETETDAPATETEAPEQVLRLRCPLRPTPVAAATNRRTDAGKDRDACRDRRLQRHRFRDTGV